MKSGSGAGQLLDHLRVVFGNFGPAVLNRDNFRASNLHAAPVKSSGRHRAKLPCALESTQWYSHDAQLASVDARQEPTPGFFCNDGLDHQARVHRLSGP